MLGASLLGVLNACFFFFGISAFFLPLEEELGISRSRLSLTISLVNLVQGFVLAPVVGITLDRFGPRRPMFVGTALLGIGWVLFARAESYLELTIFLTAFVGVGMALGTQLPAYAAMTNWFSRRRAMAFGIANTGIGVGAMVVVGTNFLVETLGWRDAAVIIGLVWVAVGLPIAAGMRHRPEQYGYLPDGELPTGRPDSLSQAQQGLTPRQVLRIPTFWFVNLAFATQVMVVNATLIHLFPALHDKGFSSSTAALLFLLYGVISIPGRLITGYVADKIEKRRLYAGLLCLLTVGFLVLAGATSFWQLVVFIALMAIGAASAGSLVQPMIAEYYGRASFGTISGMSQMVIAPGMIAGAFIAGILRDLTGAYTIGLILFSVIVALGAVLMLNARKPHWDRI